MIPCQQFHFLRDEKTRKRVLWLWSSRESSARDKVDLSFFHQTCLIIGNVLIMGACRLMSVMTAWRLIRGVHWKPANFSDEFCEASRMGEPTGDWKLIGEVPLTSYLQFQSWLNVDWNTFNLNYRCKFNLKLFFKILFFQLRSSLKLALNENDFFLY